MLEADRDEEVRVHKLVERTMDPNRIGLPPFVSSFSKDRARFTLEILERGIKRKRSSEVIPFAEAQGYLGQHVSDDIALVAAEGITRLRGFIRRQEAGFVFEDADEPAVVPAAPLELPVGEVEPAVGDGQ